MHKRESGGHNVEIRDHSACLLSPLYGGIAGGLVAKESVSKTSRRHGFTVEFREWILPKLIDRQRIPAIMTRVGKGY